jgi:hypothetical protein
MIGRAWRLLRNLFAFNRSVRRVNMRRGDWRRVPRPVWAAKRGGVEVW